MREGEEELYLEWHWM